MEAQSTLPKPAAPPLCREDRTGEVGFEPGAKLQGRETAFLADDSAPAKTTPKPLVSVKTINRSDHKIL